MLLIHFIIFTVRIASADKFSYSSFDKTQVIFDTCDKGNEISRKFEDSVFQCHITCAGNADCRRFLYCSFDSTCILYMDGTHCGTWEFSSSCSCYRKVMRCSESRCTCPLGFYGNSCQHVVKDCKDADNRGIAGKRSLHNVLVYIQPVQNRPPVEVLCVLDHGGGLIVAYRYTKCKFVSFNASLAEYEQGFGVYRYNRWLGLDTVKAVMANYPNSSFRLQVILTNTDNQQCACYYNKFQISDRSDGYRLSYHDYYPGAPVTCGDALASQKGSPFSTYDDDKTGTRRCAQTLGGGWWFNNDSECTSAFLTGTMDTNSTGNIWQGNLSGELLNRIIVILWVA